MFRIVTAKDYTTLMITHVIDFLIDYFTNLSVKKIFGGIIVLLSLAIISKGQISGDPNRAVLYAIVGILIGGIGFIVIYYDMAKDKIGHEYDDIQILTKAYEQKVREERKVNAWHMDKQSSEKNTQDKNK